MFVSDVRHVLSRRFTLISLAKAFIFVHIPRTGGNSIQSTLIEHADDVLVKKSEDLNQFGLTHREFALTKHSKLRDYHTALGDRVKTDFFKFTCLRNPWDRILSRWFRFKYGATNLPTTRGRSVFRRPVEPVWSKEAFIRFIRWHLENTGGDAWSIMPWITLDGDVCMDGYIRYERMQQDYDDICDVVGLPRRNLPRLNRSRRPRSYQTYYDTETRDLVARVCADEIKYFDLEFPQ